MTMLGYAPSALHTLSFSSPTVRASDSAFPSASSPSACCFCSICFSVDWLVALSWFSFSRPVKGPWAMLTSRTPTVRKCHMIARDCKCLVTRHARGHRLVRCRRHKIGRASHSILFRADDTKRLQDTARTNDAVMFIRQSLVASHLHARVSALFRCAVWLYSATYSSSQLSAEFLPARA
jgi:hypothetical protein